MMGMGLGPKKIIKKEWSDKKEDKIGRESFIHGYDLKIVNNRFGS